MSENRDNKKRDRRVLELYEKILEVEQRLIPTGLHVFGRPSNQSEIADLLRMVASFDRPELEIRSLPDLVTEGLGLPTYSELLNESARSEQRLREREQVEAIVSQAIRLFTNEVSKEANKTAVEFLKECASVPEQESNRVFSLLSNIRARLDTSHELDGLVRALRGEYIEPGPGADIIQNPDILRQAAILMQSIRMQFHPQPRFDEPSQLSMRCLSATVTKPGAIRKRSRWCYGELTTSKLKARRLRRSSGFWE
jgi:magnesium chelatase subunit H